MNESNVEVESNEGKPFWDDDAFLAATMRQMIATSRADVDGYLNGEKNSSVLEAIVHDGLVQVWDRPMALYRSVPEELARRLEAWTEHKRSVPPRSTQR